MQVGRCLQLAEHNKRRVLVCILHSKYKRNNTIYSWKSAVTCKGVGDEWEREPPGGTIATQQVRDQSRSCCLGQPGTASCAGHLRNHSTTGHKTHLFRGAFVPTLNGADNLCNKNDVWLSLVTRDWNGSRFFWFVCLFYCTASPNLILNKKEDCHEQDEILRDYERTSL